MSKIVDAQPGSAREAGFTLFELLLVLLIAVLFFSAVLVVAGRQSGAANPRTVALALSARLRSVRELAIIEGATRSVTIDRRARFIRFDGQDEWLALPGHLTLSAETAQAASLAPHLQVVKFFPNGSSTGAVITLSRESRAYEVRVNWLSGRVAVKPLN